MATSGIPGGKGPNRATEFVVPDQVFADGGFGTALASFVSNANVPQIADYRLLAGFALVIASAVTPQGQATSAEYLYETHARAIHQAEGAKSKIWGSVRTPPTPSAAIPPLVVARQDDASQIRALVWAPASPPPVLSGVLGKFISASQADPTQLAAQIQQSLIATPVVPNPTAQFFSIPPQTEERPTRRVWNSQVAGATPAVIAWINASQADPTQIASRIWPSVVAAPIVPNPTAQFFSIPPQTEDRPTSVVWRSLVSGQTPRVPPFTTGTPQTDPSQVAAKVQPSLFAAPVVTGIMVAPIAPVPPQFDTSANASVIWTPSTFSPSAIIPPSGGGGGGILYGKAGRRWIISKPYIEQILGEDADETVFLESVAETIYEAEKPGKPELTRELATLSALESITHAYNVHFETVAAARAAIEGRLVELEDDDLMAVLMIIAMADEP